MSTVWFSAFLLMMAGGVLAEIWEFGVDAPGSIIVDQKQGHFTLFEKFKEIRLKVPRCYEMEYVRVQVKNSISVPTVKYSEVLRTVTIAYKSLQYSASTFTVIGKAARTPGCYNPHDVELEFRGSYSV